jgi:hypothetical protein
MHPDSIACTRSPLALAFGCAARAGHPPTARRERPGPRRGAEDVLRYAFPIAETSFDPAQITDLYSRTVATASSTRRWSSSSWRGRRACGPTPPPPCPRCRRRLPHLHRSASSPASFRRRPGLQGRKRERADRRLRLLDQAPLRPALEERQPLHPGKRQDPGPVGAAPRLIDEKKPFDYDTEVEGLRALDRYTFQIRWPSRTRASSTTWPTAPSPARWRARWWSSTATRSASTRWAPGRSGWRSGRAARASCWRAQPELPRELYDENPPADDAAAAGHRRR